MDKPRSLQFKTETEIIVTKPRSGSATLSTRKPSLAGFAQSHRNKRLIKLLAIFALPVIAAVAQCGSFLAKMRNVQSLSDSTTQSISSLLAIGDLVKSLQIERASALTGHDPVSSQNATDTAIDFLPAGLNYCTDETLSNITRKLRNKLLDLRHMSDYRQTDVYQPQLIAYTTVISDVLRLVGCDILIKSDKSGIMWDYVIAYELILRVKDSLEIQTALLSLFSSAVIMPEDLRWFTENTSLTEVLFNISAQHLETTEFFLALIKRRVALAEEVGCLEGSLTRTTVSDCPVLSSTRALNDTTQKLSDLLFESLDIVNTFKATFIKELNSLTSLQLSYVAREFYFAAGLLAVTVLVCPLLSVWYLRSVNEMSTLIDTYASSLMAKAAELNFEKNRTEHLLYQMLPRPVADALKQNKSVPTESYDCVTIMFSVTANFNLIASSFEPLEVIELLNTLHSMIDFDIDGYDVYKVETIGDEYLVASGLPNRNENRHAGEVADLSLKIMEDITTAKILGEGKGSLSLRIGINSGPCVAGVIGLKMPRYCLFGDTVNTASRMESNGANGQIHMSSSTKELLDTLGSYEFLSRGIVEIKGKGSMYTWWLLGKTGIEFRIPAVIPSKPDVPNSW